MQSAAPRSLRHARPAHALPAHAALTVALVLALGVAAFSLATGTGFGEASPVERLSPAAYLAAATLLVLAALAYSALDRIASLLGAACLALLAARELDWHKSELLGSLTRSSTYVDPDRPFALRVLAAMIVTGALAIALAFAWRTLREPLRAKRVPSGPVWAGAVGSLAILAFAKTIDGIGRKLAEFNLTLSDETLLWFLYLEETLELSGALGLLGSVVILAAATDSRTRREG